MKNCHAMKASDLIMMIALILLPSKLLSQEVSIVNSRVNSFGCMEVEVNSDTLHYYLLHCKPDLTKNEEWIVRMNTGENGTTSLSGNLKALPLDHYRVTQHAMDQPLDSDKDGINDIEEYDKLGRLGPFNPEKEISINDGVVCIPDRETFERLSYKGEEVAIDVHLKDLEYVKFYILDARSDNPGIYFMNTVTHRAHGSFARAIGISSGGGPGGGGGGKVAGSMRGEIVYHPLVLAPNGRFGVYRFEFEPNDAYSFPNIQMAYELLASNMPFLKNNWMYYPMPNAALPRYYREKHLYDDSRVAILLEEDIYAEIDYLALNIAGGYGLLKEMDLDDRPNSRDIVIYEALPNEISRVGGIITTVPQTPLSHVNLRAIQDNVPNAFIEDVLVAEEIADLIGKYVYFNVDVQGYQIREASMEEVENHYKDIRPAEMQYPVRDLSIKEITPLDDIDFEHSSSFGVKAANLAAMRNYGLPFGTIPNGFAVPFYFYDEFMRYNGFYSTIADMLSDPGFLNDYNLQEEILDELRDRIKDGDMPSWMMDELDEMHRSFPEGTSVRCRSSTNNEDLPGFSGAGLYDSKTQHPDEGHISKSIKQVYASMWNFRAFDERQFYRFDHFTAAMGVLCHPNFSDEMANGVGVSTDPIYMTENTYYLNTQLGEDLVTNPDALSIPEEILLDAVAGTYPGYTIIRPSNLLPSGDQILSSDHLNDMRTFLGIIHNGFKTLYDADSQDDFAIEIEYKITSENVLAVKQARPWVIHYTSDLTSVPDILRLADFVLGQNFPNPFLSSTSIEFSLGESASVLLSIYNNSGKKIMTLINDSLTPGSYSVEWNGMDSTGRSIKNGTYHYQLIVKGRFGTTSETKSLLRLK